MPDYVRVKDADTGHELTVQRSELVHKTYSELDKPAVNELGDPLPPKHASPKSTTKGQPAADQKEN